MAISKEDQQKLELNFMQMQSTFEYVLNRNDYNTLTPALKIYILKISQAGGGPNDVRYHLKDLGAKYQREKIIPLAVQELLDIKTSDSHSKDKTDWPKDKETFWKVEDFLEFSDDWAYELERFNYCILPDDMDKKLEQFFEQGNSANVFNKAFRFGGIENELFVVELIEDLYKLSTPKDQWIDITV